MTLTYQKVNSPCGIPFDVKPIKIKFEKKCQSIEFIEHTHDCIALFGEKEIVLIHDILSPVPKIEPYIIYPRSIECMHLTHDGKFINILDYNGTFHQVNIISKAENEQKWIKERFSDYNSIEGKIEDWDVSPDGKTIAFSTVGPKDHITHLYTADINGLNIKCLTKGDPSELRMRYRLNNRDLLVSPHRLLIDVLQQLDYIGRVEWYTPNVLQSSNIKQ